MDDNGKTLAEGAAVEIDDLLATIDEAKDNPVRLFMIALESFQDAGAVIKPDASGEDARQFVSDITLAYFAVGTLLDAKHDLMVRSVRQE
jgi:hypothetical protein